MSKYKKKKRGLYGRCYSDFDRCDFYNSGKCESVDKKTNKALLDICSNEKVIFKKVSEWANMKK
jgi:hypothetical protein